MTTNPEDIRAIYDTLFDNIANRSHLGQSEAFAPIGAVIGFDSDEEAVRPAGDPVLGFGGKFMPTRRSAATAGRGWAERTANGIR